MLINGITMSENVLFYLPSKKSLKNAMTTVKPLNPVLVILLLCLTFSGYLPFISVFKESLIPFSDGGPFVFFTIMLLLISLIILGAPLKVVRILAIIIPLVYIVFNFKEAKELFDATSEYFPEIFKFGKKANDSGFGSLVSSMIEVKFGVFVMLAGLIGYVLVICGFRYKVNNILWNVLFLKDDATLVKRSTFSKAELWVKQTVKELSDFIIDIKTCDKEQRIEKLKKSSVKNIIIIISPIFLFFYLAFVTISALFFSPTMTGPQVKQAIIDTYSQEFWGGKIVVDVDHLSISNCEQYSDEPLGIECHIKAVITKKSNKRVLEVLNVDENESFQLEKGKWVYYD